MRRKALFTGWEGSFFQNDEERFWSESRKRQFRADFGKFTAISCRGRRNLEAWGAGGVESFLQKWG